MPGYPLMCVWHAADVIDPSSKQGPRTSVLKHIVSNFIGLPIINYSEANFEKVFQNPTVKFTEFTTYVEEHLCSSNVPFIRVLAEIEENCWQLSASSYSSTALNQTDLKRMWYIFNRVCDEGSYPVKIAARDEYWFLEKVIKCIPETWNERTLPTNDMTFQRLINFLEKAHFSITPPPKIGKSTDEIFTWIVKEVMKTGWLHKRSRNHSNWTNWQKRWCVLMPGCLSYYEKENMKTLKGHILLEKTTLAEDLKKGDSTKHKYRFKIASMPSYEIELSAKIENEKTEWLEKLHQSVDAVRRDVTPMMALLRERNTQPNSRQNTNSQLEMTRLVAKRANDAQIGDIKIGAADSENGDLADSDLAVVEHDKLQALFMQIDTDGNGQIDKEEFAKFLKNLGTNLDILEVDKLFCQIDRDNNGYVVFEEFYNAFLKMIMGESSTCEEAKLRAAFLEADRDGSGKISFKEFAEFVSSRRGSVSMAQVLNVFEELDTERKGQIDYTAFRHFLDNQSIVKNIYASLGSGESCQTFADVLKNTYKEVDASSLARYLQDRWKSFASFKRTNAKGELVMEGLSNTVSDVLPGKYNLVDLVCFNDLPPIKPKHAAIKGVQWLSGTECGKSGRAIFPQDFDANIPVDIATSEHLAYYGATLATGNQIQISLLYRHAIQDFTYQNNYLNDYVTDERALGGAGIEKHRFAHLDCPLDDDSGIFIIAKYVGDELHVTGFKIPTRHTLYLPGGVIHSNDYLKGTWRTMLSDEAEIDHVQLVKLQRKDDRNLYEKFVFAFSHY